MEFGAWLVHDGVGFDFGFNDCLGLVGFSLWSITAYISMSMVAVILARMIGFFFKQSSKRSSFSEESLV